MATTDRPNVSAAPVTPAAIQPQAQAPKATPTEPVPSAPIFDPKEAVKTRTPFGGFQKKLDVLNQIPGYVLFWINDDGARVPTVLQHGYQFVEGHEVGMAEGVLTNNRDLGGRVSRPVGRKADGSTMFAYLMKLPIEFWEQDRAAHDERQAGIDAAIKGSRGGVAGVGVSQDGLSYNPLAHRGVRETVERSSGSESSPTGMVTTRVKTMG